MINVLFFGKLSDDLGERLIDIDAPDNASINTIIGLIGELKGQRFADALAADDIVAAANKTVQADRDAANTGLTEVAFFPPVTGG